jgi:hypothetical protein
MIKAELLTAPIPKVSNCYAGKRTINSFNSAEVPLKFRFRSHAQLNRLIVGFQFPPYLYDKAGHKLSAEEVLLVGLYRLHAPNNLADLQEIFGMKLQRAGQCFHIFLNFMTKHWSYLLLDNMDFWLPYLPHCAEAIRGKVASAWDCHFPPANQNGGFSVFGFIDNTMNACCRPASGPTRDEHGAPRHDREIQRAWYNGWKKLHGFKWQTVDLPNGMNFHVYGPVSVRHNDLYTLHHSDINGKLDRLQSRNTLKFKIYGDSAYFNLSLDFVRSKHDPEDPAYNARLQLENRALSSVREVIEWDYGEVGKYWAMTHYKYGLRMMGVPVAKIYLTALILRNAHCTMNGNLTSSYFEFMPPTFETWVAAGPRGRIQDNSY